MNNIMKKLNVLFDRELNNTLDCVVIGVRGTGKGEKTANYVQDYLNNRK